MTDRVAKNDGNGSSDDDSTLITDAALACAGRGWPVFPVDPNTKKPYLSAKFSNGQRWGQTIDMVGPILLLATDAGAYVTGNVILADGGILCRTFD